MKQDNITVLLIEDDPMVQEVNRQMIEKVEGFCVDALAGDGREGIELAEKLAPDLVILDIFMPELDGVKTLNIFRREELDIDVIVVSAADDTETIKRTFQYGAIDYIIKPFKFERLVQALNKYRTFLHHFSGKHKTAQQEIDSLVSQQKDEANETMLPKGLNEQTLTKIKDYLNNQCSPVSAGETAANIGVARVTARRYLDYLVKVNQADIHLRYGEVGRPINRYMLK